MVFDAHSDLLYDVTRRRLLGERQVLERHHLDRLRRGGVAILYTMEYTLLKKLIREHPGLRLVTEVRTEAGGLMPAVFVIKIGQ